MSGAVGPVAESKPPFLNLNMSKPFVLPFQQIGEPNWVENLRSYLEGYDISCEGESPAVIESIDAQFHSQLPTQLKEYYLHFGKTSCSDYMYNLRPVTELTRLFASNWSFINLNFYLSDYNKMIEFSGSPAHDPICFDTETGAIYLFSHDPIKTAKVFTDFNQYVLSEVLETEREIGNSGLSLEDVSRLVDEYLPGEDIDYEFRRMKL